VRLGHPASQRAFELGRRAKHRRRGPARGGPSHGAVVTLEEQDLNPLFSFVHNLCMTLWIVALWGGSRGFVAFAVTQCRIPVTSSGVNLPRRRRQGELAARAVVGSGLDGDGLQRMSRSD